MDDLCKRIDKILKERNISGAQLSRDLEISKSFMTELRKGRAKSITLENAVAVSDYLGVSLDYLARGEKTKKEPADNSEPDIVLTEDESMLIQLFRLLPTEQQNAAVNMIKSLATSQGLM